MVPFHCRPKSAGRPEGKPNAPQRSGTSQGTSREPLGGPLVGATQDQSAAGLQPPRRCRSGGSWCNAHPERLAEAAGGRQRVRKVRPGTGETVGDLLESTDAVQASNTPDRRVANTSRPVVEKLIVGTPGCNLRCLRGLGTFLIHSPMFWRGLVR